MVKVIMAHKVVAIHLRRVCFLSSCEFLILPPTNALSLLTFFFLRLYFYSSDIDSITFSHGRLASNCLQSCGRLYPPLFQGGDLVVVLNYLADYLFHILL